jgi:hypothetical protein
VNKSADCGVIIVTRGLQTLELRPERRLGVGILRLAGIFDENILGVRGTRTRSRSHYADIVGVMTAVSANFKILPRQKRREPIL